MSGNFVLRLAAWVLALSLVALPIVGLLKGWFASERWPFQLVKLEAELQHLGAEQIRAAVAPHLSPGFFAVNLDAVRGAVAALPWVQTVEARKRWPNMLELRVYEQQPLARWDRDRLINRSGNLFQVPGAAALQGLPELSGPDELLDEVIDFYAASQRAFSGTGQSVAAVGLSARGSWAINLAGGTRLTLGREQPELRLDRFVAQWPQLMAERDAPPLSADLRYSNGFTLAWPQPALPPRPAPQDTATPTSPSAPAADPAPENDA